MKLLYEYNRESSGYTISATKKGLKLSCWFANWNIIDKIYYVEEFGDFNRNTDFSKKWNDFYTYGEIFEEWVKEAEYNPYTKIKIYRKIK